MQIQKYINRFVVITWNGTHLHITEEQHKKLITLGEKDSIRVEGNIIRGSSIAEVLTLEKYYETFPDKKHEIPKYTYPDGAGEWKKIPFTKARHIKAIKSMIKGFKMNFEGREIPTKSQKILDNMYYRLRLSEEDPSDERSNPVEEIINISF